MKALTVPVDQYFKTYDDYMRDYHGYQYDEDQEAYGYYTNPNAQWDWYQVGGRWPFCFLVRDDCQSAIIGERGWSWKQEDFEAARKGPEGYIWVAGAKKCDIEWDLMKQLGTEKQAKLFRLCEKWAVDGERPEAFDSLYVLTDKGVENWGDILYVHDETLEANFKRFGCDQDKKYAYTTYAYLDEGRWLSQGDMGWFGISSNEMEPATWQDMVEQFIDKVPDDYLLVSVDCHI